ncbi:MAG: amino acid ABC transporter substrate-binding protein [Candidatus Izemoplasmatales bacterium]|nr:amino acid ABC transporter substrate-binding protein [Candidatus Izemoplasmatales bacterium]
MKKLALLMMSMMAVFALSACTSDTETSSWDTIQERGYFIVGLDNTFAPMGFVDDFGDLVGFDVDLAKEVANRLGVDVQFLPIEWDSKVLELNAKTIDMIWNGLTITDARQLEMTFSEPYLANKQIVITAGGSSIDTIADLAGLKVGVQISSAAEEAVNANAIVDSLGELVQYDSYDQALLDLKNGVIDAVVMDEIMGRYMISQTSDSFQIASEDFGDEEYGIGFRLGDTDLAEMFNSALQAMRDDGTAAEISITWFGEDIFLD